MELLEDKLDKAEVQRRKACKEEVITEYNYEMLKQRRKSYEVGYAFGSFQRMFSRAWIRLLRT